MDSFTLAYSLLLVLTAAVGVGIMGLWRVTRIPHFLLGLSLIYYFSLAGAWRLVDLKLNGATTPSLEHLENSLFPILIDSNYLLSLTIYGIFNLALIVALRFIVAGTGRVAMPRIGRETASSAGHRWLLGIAAVSLVLSIALIWGAISSALEEGVSAYSVSRGETNQFFTLHQILNRIGLDALAIGLGLCVLGSRRGFVLFCYLCIAVLWTLFLGVLGNRNELLVAAVAGVLWYYSLGGRIGTGRIVWVGLLGFFVMRLIESTREWGLDGIATNFTELVASADFWNPFALATGSESLAAHMSLYGILARDIDLTYGSSILYLINSLIPRVFVGERVPDSYTIYADAVSAPDTQGFTIHFAAASYLNFGILGVIIGAAALALVWGGLLRRLKRKDSTAFASYGPLLAAFCFCSAYVPIMMRGGPEGFKGLFIEGLCIPYFLAWLAVHKVVAPNNLRPLIHSAQ